MAQITLKILGDIKDAESKIKVIKNELEKLDNHKIKVSVDTGSVDSFAQSVQKAANGAQNLGNSLKIDASALKDARKALYEFREDTDGNTRQTDKFNLAIGKTRTIIVDTGKDSQRTTTILRENYDQIRKVAEQAAKAKEKEAREEERAAGLAKQYLLEEAQAQAKAAEAAAKVVTPMQAQINAITGVGNAYKSAAESAKVFEKESLNVRLGTDENTRAQAEANRLLDYWNEKEAKAAAEAEARAAKIITPAQAQINAANGIGKAYKSAQDSAAFFRLNGLTPLEKELRKNEKTMDDLAGRSESLISNIVKFTRWYLIGNAVSSVARAFRDAFTEMKAVDSELVTVRKVTDMSAESLEKLRDRAYEVASAYGVSADSYLNAAAEFARAGYKDQSADLAELAVKTQLVGDVTQETANQFLLAVDKGYQLGGSIEKLSYILDGANELDNKYATSIEKIAEGLGAVAPVAAQMHVSVEELSASIGTITAVTQRSGSEAARALRALMLNIVGDTKTEIEEGVTWTTGEIAGLRDVIKTYAPEAYKAAQATGEIINPMEAIAGLSKSMKDGLLTEQQLMEMVSDIGGKLRTSQLLALIQNWDMYTSMVEDFTNSMGSANKEVNNALDSWEVKLQQVKSGWTQFVQSFTDTRAIKATLDSIIWLLDKVNTKLGADFNTRYSAGTLSGLMEGYVLTLDEGKKDQLKDAVDSYYEAVEAGEEISSKQKELIQSIMDMLGYYGEYTPAIRESTDAVDENTTATVENADAKQDNADATEELRTATDDLAEQFDSASGALKDYAEYGGVTGKKLQALQEALPEVTSALFDEKGALNEAGTAAFETASNLDNARAATEYLQAAAQTANYQNLINQITAAGTAAILTTQQIATMLEAVGVSANVADAQARGMAMTAKYKGTATGSEFSGYLNSQLSYLKTRMSGITSAYTKTTKSSSSSSSSGSDKDPELERLKGIVSLRESELSLLEASGASDAERFAKIKEIQLALYEQAEYLRSIGASEEEIIPISVKWWNYQNETKKATEETAKALRDGVAEELKGISDIVSDIREQAVGAIDDQIDALKAERDEQEAITEEAEKQLAVEKAREALNNAKKERTVRQYNASTGQWENVANAKDVDKAQSALEKAQEELNDFLSDQEYKANLAALQTTKENTESAYKAFQDAWKEVADAIKDGKMSFEDAYDYIDKAMRKIYEDYGIDISSVLGDINGKFGDLSDEASKLLLIAKMRYNSAAYFSADEAGRAELADENLRIGTSLGWTRRNGVWYDENGNVAYTVEAQANYQASEYTNSTASGGTSSGSSSNGGTSNGGTSGGGSDGSSSGGSAYYSQDDEEPTHSPYTSEDGSWTVTTDKAKDFIDNAKAGETMIGGDGSVWVANADGTVTATTPNGKTYTYGAYDSGGILSGLGGIKATREDELVLPPDLTKAVLQPALDGVTAQALDAMRVMYGMKPVSTVSNILGGNSIGTQNNGDTIYINGIDLSERVTRGTTIGELAALARTLPLHVGS